MDGLKEIKLSARDGTRRSFWHRGTNADLGVLGQIFRNEDYSLSLLNRGQELGAFFAGLLASGKKPLIVDAGANIGASAVWFSMTFPGSHILCYEPDHHNFELLQRNTAGLDVDLNSAAVGSEDGNVALIDPGGGEWAYRTKIEKDGAYKLIALGPALDSKIRAGFTPFIVKIDIEGGEENLFRTNTDWVDEFPLLVIELHDGLFQKQANSRNFLKCIAQRDRDFVYVGENIFSIKNG